MTEGKRLPYSVCVGYNITIRLRRGGHDGPRRSIPYLSLPIRWLQHMVDTDAVWQGLQVGFVTAGRPVLGKPQSVLDWRRKGKGLSYWDWRKEN